MTGFRVTAVGSLGPRRRGRGLAPDLMTFGKVMGGGFPAAAFGGRADVMDQLAPSGPVYQAGTLSGNPDRHHRRADDAAAGGRRGLRARSTRPRRRCRRWSARRSSAAGVAHVIQRAGNMFSVFWGVDEPVDRLRRRAAAGDAGGSRRSSTRCSTPASTCRPARSRRGSSRRRTTTRHSLGWPTALPAAARAPPQATPSEGRLTMTERTIVHLMRHGEVHNPTACSTAGCPSYYLSRPRPPDGRKRSPTRWQGRDVTYLVASPLERAQQTAEPPARAPRPADRDRRARDRGRQLVRGPDVRRRRRLAAAPAALVAPAQPVRPSWGEPYKDIAARMRAAVARRPRGGARPRGGHRVAPAAGLDRPSVVREAVVRRTTRGERQCTLASLTTPDLRRRRVRRPRRTPSRPAHLLPAGAAREVRRGSLNVHVAEPSPSRVAAGGRARWSSSPGAADPAGDRSTEGFVSAERRRSPS